MNAVKRFVNQVRSILGWMLHEWHERGLEFAVAGVTIVNARQTLFQTADGRPLAPFLSSALKVLADRPPLWTLILAITGVFHMGIVLTSFGRDWFKARAMICMFQSVLYVAISTAIITGPSPHEAAERFMFTAWVAFWVSVALGSQAAGKARKKAHDKAAAVMLDPGVNHG